MRRRPRQAALSLRQRLSDAGASRRPDPWVRVSGPNFRLFASRPPSESCPIRQAYRTSPPPDKRGGFLATAGDKAPPRIHHAQVIRADLDPRRRPVADLGRRALAPPATARASQAEPRRKPRNGKPFRRRRRSRPGRGRAEGQGRAIPCSAPAPGSRCSTLFCAPTRPPPGRCAPAWRFRAPRPPPRSCASTRDEGALRDLRFAVGDPLGPAAKLLRSGATSPAGRPASTPAGSPPRRRGSTWLCRTRTASHPA